MDSVGVSRSSEQAPSASPTTPEPTVLLKDYPEMYQNEIKRLMLVASMLELIDCAGLAETAQSCHTLGPIVDPTAYRAAMDRLTPMAELARAAAKTVKALRAAREAFSASEPQAAAYRELHRQQTPTCSTG